MNVVSPDGTGTGGGVVVERGSLEHAGADAMTASAKNARVRGDIMLETTELAFEE
jgi:hypothetical protein